VTTADAPAVHALIVAADVAVQGFSDSSEPDLLQWWRRLELEPDSWLIEDGGSLAAYGMLESHGKNAELDGFVHPDRKGQGLGSWLLARGEERARERKLPHMMSWCLAPDQDARRLHEQRGYTDVRRFYRMLIELEEPPPVPEWPDGFTVHTYTPADARAFHETLTKAFEDEWNFVPMPFEDWIERRVTAPSFDPTLWFIVREDGRIAAVLRADPEVEGAGWVGALGVLKPWRKRGLGLALLRHAFAVFYERGQPRIALGVDAQNPTGATRLYERAGMRVSWEAVAFQRDLA
jgi:mycothiol synthase